MFYCVENMTFLLICGLSSAQPNRGIFLFWHILLVIPFVYSKLAYLFITDKHSTVLVNFHMLCYILLITYLFCLFNI